MSIEMKAKHAEESLDRLDWIIKKMLKPLLEDVKKKSKDPMSEAIQQRSMMIADLEKTHTACWEMLHEFSKAQADNAVFIEHIRRDILLPGDKVPKEMFTEQAELFSKELESLIARYNDTVNNYFTRKKGE